MNRSDSSEKKKISIRNHISAIKFRINEDLDTRTYQLKISLSRKKIEEATKQEDLDRDILAKQMNAIDAISYDVDWHSGVVTRTPQDLKSL